jgi:hypothetical protein
VSDLKNGFKFIKKIEEGKKILENKKELVILKKEESDLKEKL